MGDRPEDRGASATPTGPLAEGGVAKASPAKPSVPSADDVRLLSAGPDARGGFTFSFADANPDGIIRLIAEHLYEMMGCGTPHELNCIQMDVKPRDCAQAFSLTLQREGGKTPLRLKAEAKQLLEQALKAIESGRREPLEIVRDQIRNWIEADPASAIEGSAQDAQRLDPQGESAVAATSGETPNPSEGTPHAR